MKRSTIHAPPAQVFLGGHPPAPARVELAYQPVPGRLLRALLALVVCWGAIPYLVWVPPHYPWVIAALIAGVALSYRFWMGKYQIRSFTAGCPRCGRALVLAAGVKINLPHTLTCYGCHFESVLEVRIGQHTLSGGEGRSLRVEHRQPECVGVWRVYWVMDQPWTTCERCGARRYASPEVRRVVERENEHTRLLEQLTTEGRFLL